MGTKRKFWFSRAGEMWLYKATRPGSGEHWAEVWPRDWPRFWACPTLTTSWRGGATRAVSTIAGVVSRRFMPAGFDLVHGNELLAERDPSYPAAGAPLCSYSRAHDRGRQECVGGRYRPAAELDAAPGHRDARRRLRRLSALGCVDRQHGSPPRELGLVVNLAEGRRYLAPTFDHASSLGAHQEDADRARRLESKDPRVRVEGYVEKARSALYSKAGEAKPITPLDAFRAWCEHASCDPWLQRLDTVEDGKVADFIGRVPDSEMSGPARAFAQAILQRNKWRILRAR